jgi:hypothetical protein
VVCLFVLSPLVAEYLSGSLPASMIAILPLMAAMYGSGALLIREAAIRSRGGWPSIVLLAAAYGFIEEGWVDQSLFNPNYQGLRLLDYGFVPALGTGLPWLLYVIAIHVVWSMATPLALTDCLFPERRKQPWLAWWSIALFALLYLGSSAAVASYSYTTSHFMASPAELAWSGAVIVALLAAAASVSCRQPGEASGDAPGAPALFLLGFVPGAVLVVLSYFGSNRLHLPWQGAVAVQIALGSIAVTGLVALGRRKWTGGQRLSLTAGLFAVYFASGFLTSATLHGPADLPGHALIAALCVGVLAMAWRRAARESYQGISLPS